MRLWPMLLLALLATAFAAEESCMDRCENGFDSQKSCQCDSMCKYYTSCCFDFATVCRMNNRGDTFVIAEDDDDSFTSTPTPQVESSHHRAQPTYRPQPTRHPQRTHHKTPNPVNPPWALDPVTQRDPNTKVPTTQAPTTQAPTTQAPTTQSPMTQAPTAQSPITQTPTTQAPTAQSPITQAPTTQASTTLAPTTQASTTLAPTTQKVSMTKAPTVVTTAPVTTTTTPTTTKIVTTTPTLDPDADICSGRPFDSFTQVKNGSVYAFRGNYFFELDQKRVLPGYPKLIKDVWGISGPIDAAFTRMNCQGKTYIFKGNRYWRFEDGVMDDDYPRDINVGFDKIPDHVDAAFALPAPGHHAKEKVYFFKSDQYYLYEFMHQPSHEQCVAMSERSPSTLFSRYMDVYFNNYEQFFSELFSDMPDHKKKHHFITKDWKGIKSPINAVLAGRIYIAPPSPAGRDDYRYDPQRNQQYGRDDYRYDPQRNQQYGRDDYQYDPQRNQQYGQQRTQYYQQYGQQWEQQYGQQWGRRRQNRSPFWETLAERGMNMGQGFADRGMDMGLRLAERGMEMEGRLGRDWDGRWDQDRDQDRQRDGNRRNDGNYDSRYNPYGNNREQRNWPLQSVYFFKGDKYYRVDLQTKRVDPGNPPYPRSIAKYWLGCSDPIGAEK